jgi:hypothetical protein
LGTAKSGGEVGTTFIAQVAFQVAICKGVDVDSAGVVESLDSALIVDRFMYLVIIRIFERI